jgi:transposase
MSGYWAKAPQSRSQMVLFTTTLDDSIASDHPVRLLAEILERVDWSEWEAEYHGRIGQPPIHPRILAGLWLYALRRGFRSSRKLEYFTRSNIDFMWLAEGHTPDHLTLSDFRMKFAKALRGRFRQMAHIALTMGFLQLVDVANDGTRVKAQSNRFETWTAETPFALLKHIMGLRQFLLRGLEKVKVEWRWACLAANVGKLVRDIQRVRRMVSALVAEGTA